MTAIRTITTTTTAAPATSAASDVGTFSAADEAFFRITASLFAPSFCFGAGVLLATYDDEADAPAVTPDDEVGHASCPVAPAPTPASA